MKFRRLTISLKSNTNPAMHNLPHQTDKGHNKRLIAAVVLSALIMVAWQYFYEIPLKREQNAARVKAQRELVLKREAELKANPDLADQIVQQREKKPEVKQSRAEILSESERVKISNKNLHGSLRVNGARFDDITLAKYNITVDEKSPEVVLLSPGSSGESSVIDLGWVGSPGVNVPDSSTEWKVEGNKRLGKGEPVTLTWDNGQGFRFINTYSLDESYMFTVEQKIENTGNVNATFYPFGLISKSQPEEEKSDAMLLHTGPLGVMDGTLTEVSYDSLREEKSQVFDNATGWIGITDKYWFKSLIPAQDEKYKATFRYHLEGQREKFQVDFLGQARQVAPGETISYSSKIFAGAKELDLLEKYRDEYNLPLFDRAIDFGWFYFLSKPLMKLLKFFYQHIENFGICILLLTFVVKLLLFPLARKSYVAMGKLKVLGPKIKDLQTRFKEDKMQLNREMMELYKRERVNPASGCLPILLQIPVFIALYKVFFVSIEMRHAPFFGWVDDLSAKDPTTIFNLFGLLPFDPPSFLMIGAWPLLWVMTMMLQQKVSPAPTDPTQAQIMKIMPWIFLIMFASFPVGLVIYWTFSNMLSILQQLYFLRHLPRK